jgi:hypothetical protein
MPCCCHDTLPLRWYFRFIFISPLHFLHFITPLLLLMIFMILPRWYAISDWFSLPLLMLSSFFHYFRLSFRLLPPLRHFAFISAFFDIFFHFRFDIAFHV